MIIEVYFDVVCPWTWVGKRRLEAALAVLGEAAPTVRWLPYLLDPTAPRQSISLAENPEAEAAQLQSVPGFNVDLLKQRVAQLAGAEGLPTPVPACRVSTWAAHRLIQDAADQGPQVQSAVVEEIMAAHFSGTDINRLDFLGAVAARFGLRPPAGAGDASHAPAYLEPGFDPQDPGERATREAYWAGRARDIASSPTFVVHGAALVGAQPVETLVNHITSAPALPRELPDEVRRIRLAEALLDRRDPHGCLYVLAPLRQEHDGDPNLEILTARALLASASLRPARDKLAKLVERYPGDAYLHGLLGRALKRLGDPEAKAHLAIAGALAPDEE
ncbi:MAG: DsbA family protein [Propionicimonas sp.]|uniref:DsbA family protein n=1 Tax=Propionicimonas sp. TaxID=1955623 RepID=UPI002B213932|nr:DsbA family protein [Propionicimonas sp.]MEA4943182.1 DsbA family protein [Propionicimonas sp.]